MIVTKSGSPKKGAKSLNVSYKAGFSWEKVADIPEFQNGYGARVRTSGFRHRMVHGVVNFGSGNVYDGTGNVIAKTTSGVDSIPGCYMGYHGCSLS
jgi:hypothetical protein